MNIIWYYLYTKFHIYDTSRSLVVIIAVRPETEWQILCGHYWWTYILPKELKIAFFWDMMPNNLVDKQQYFGEWNSQSSAFRMGTPHSCGMLVPIYQLNSIYTVLQLPYRLLLWCNVQHLTLFCFLHMHLYTTLCLLSHTLTPLPTQEGRGICIVKTSVTFMWDKYIVPQIKHSIISRRLCAIPFVFRK